MRGRTSFSSFLPCAAICFYQRFPRDVNSHLPSTSLARVFLSALTRSLPLPPPFPTTLCIQYLEDTMRLTPVLGGATAVVAARRRWNERKTRLEKKVLFRRDGVWYTTGEDLRGRATAGTRVARVASIMIILFRALLPGSFRDLHLLFTSVPLSQSSCDLLSVGSHR